MRKIRESLMLWIFSENSSKLTIMISSASVILGFFVFVVIFLVFLWYKNWKLRSKHWRELTDEEVNNFNEGYSIIDPRDPLSAIYSLPFNRKYEIPRNQLKLGMKIYRNYKETFPCQKYILRGQLTFHVCHAFR